MKDEIVIKKYDYLNAVRGIAILLVILLHVSQTVDRLPDWFFQLCTRGAYGVQLFFIASAFTIYHSYSRRIKVEGENAQRNFFIRRLFRITPLYYLAAIFYVIYYSYHPEDFQQKLNLLKVIPSILYINGFFPGAINYIPPGGWSVGVEMAFYCTVPFLFKRVNNLKKAIWLFIILFTGAMLIKFLARYIMVYYLNMNYHSLEGWTLYFWFPNQVVIFSLGIILYFIIPSYHFRKKWLGLGIVSLSFIALICLFLLRDKYDKYYLIPEHIAAAMIFSVIVFIMSKVDVKLLNNKITRVLGEISFSLYLIHFVVVYFVSSFLPVIANPFMEFFIRLILVIILAGGISSITYIYIEKKGIRLGEKLISNHKFLFKK